VIGFKHLQAFVTIVEEKSFTKAADRLYQTQPALSIQIKNLENILEVKLIERKEKEILLTDAGSIFYPEAKKMLENYTRTIEALAELKGLHQGNLSIGASTLPGEYILPEIVGKFKKIYPGVKVELKIADTGEVIEALKNREVQIGFLGVFPDEQKLYVHEFREDQLQLVVSPKHEKNFQWSKFPIDSLILREHGSGTRKIIEEHLKKNLNLNKIIPKMEVGSTRAVINMVAAGLGISYISEWAAEEAILLGKLKIAPYPENVIKRTLYGAVLQDNYLSYAAQAFWGLAIGNTIGPQNL